MLASLRDACRRFSIDTDRVFLTGHSIGGNAAWDMGLAHPDLWAGVIPIVAQCEKYCTLYWENASLVPFYVLGGELDGDKTVSNAPRSGPLPEPPLRRHGGRVSAAAATRTFTTTSRTSSTG